MKKREMAKAALINARFLVFQKAAAKRGLGAMLEKYVVFLRGQVFGHFGALGFG